MSILLIENKKVEISVGKGNGTYEISINLQRRNPLNQQRFKPIPCWYCEEKQCSSIGRKKWYYTINQIHGHLSFDHQNENWEGWLLGLVTDIFHGRLN